MTDITIPTGDDGIEPALLSYRQVRAILGIGETKLGELVRAGSLPAKMLGGRPAIPTAAVRAYVAGLPDAPVSKGRAP